MSEEYTPTTEEVRKGFASYQDYEITIIDESLWFQFDRWLASHDLELREKIAKEIETLRWKGEWADELLIKMACQTRDRCAEIARGKKANE